MKISVILAHPDPGRFNHAIAETAVETLHRAGHAVSFHDLYGEGFVPILPAAEIPAGASLPPATAAHCRQRRHATRGDRLAGLPGSGRGEAGSEEVEPFESA